MVSFTPKKITTVNSLGEELRRARNAKNISIEAASNRLKIKRDYLVSLEMEDFDNLPTGLYGKNYLKRYAAYVGADQTIVDDFLEYYFSDIKKSNPFSQKVLEKRKFLIFPKIIRNLLITLALVICGSYLIFYFNSIVSPPILTIDTPAQDLILTESTITVSGWAEKGSEITINGELILTNDENNFSRLISLKKGMNTIEISAQKKYSRENIVIRQILVE